MNKSAFYGQPAQLCDAEIKKIKLLAPLTLHKKFLHLLDKRFAPRNRYFCFMLPERRALIPAAVMSTNAPKFFPSLSRMMQKLKDS